MRKIVDKLNLLKGKRVLNPNHHLRQIRSPLGAEGGWSGATQLKCVATSQSRYLVQTRSQCKELLRETLTHLALKRLKDV